MTHKVVIGWCVPHRIGYARIKQQVLRTLQLFRNHTNSETVFFLDTRVVSDKNSETAFVFLVFGCRGVQAAVWHVGTRLSSTTSETTAGSHKRRMGVSFFRGHPKMVPR